MAGHIKLLSKSEQPSFKWFTAVRRITVDILTRALSGLTLTSCTAITSMKNMEEILLKAVFDPKVRAAMKQAPRDRDDEALARGEVSPRELQRRNGMYSIMKGANLMPRLLGHRPMYLRDGSVAEELNLACGAGSSSRTASSQVSED